MEFNEISAFTQEVIAGFLVILYIVLLLKVKNKYPFITMLAAILLVSNICNCIVPYAYYQVSVCVPDLNCKEVELWQIICAVLFPLSYGCFNVAHWLFASEYYKIAKIMPYALEELPVPDEIKTKHKCVNGLMLFLNIIFPIASGPIGYFTDKADINNNGRDPKDDM